MHCVKGISMQFNGVSASMQYAMPTIAKFWYTGSEGNIVSDKGLLNSWSLSDCSTELPVYSLPDLWFFLLAAPGILARALVMSGVDWRLNYDGMFSLTNSWSIRQQQISCSRINRCSVAGPMAAHASHHSTAWRWRPILCYNPLLIHCRDSLFVWDITS